MRFFAGCGNHKGEALHILIDVQGLQSPSRFRGVGRSTLAMSRAIIENAGEHRVSILINGMYSLENIEEVKNRYRDMLPEDEMYIFSGWGPTAWGDIANHPRYQAAKQVRDVAIAHIDPDVVIVLNLFEGYQDDYTVSVPLRPVPWKTVVVCHDLIPLLNKEYYLREPNFSRFYLQQLAEFEHADAVFAISDSAAMEVCQHTSVPMARVINISSAVGDEFGVREYSEQYQAQLRQRYQLPPQFVLALAIIEPRKNIETLLHAYSLLPDALQCSYPLVLAYNVSPEDRQRLLTLADNWQLNRERLIFTDYLPDDDLIALYNLCKVFIYPSLHEGFGLPVLEAMKCGAATLASNATSLPEVVGWEEATFDPLQPGHIADALQRALVDREFWLALKQHALKQAAKFSWDHTARRAIKGATQLMTASKASPQDAARHITRQVIDQLRQLTGLSQVDHLGLAWAIARNRFRLHRRKLLVDISMLAEFDDKTGIQRVSRSILGVLLNRGVEGYDVAAVRYHRGECYRYANQFVKQHYGYDYGADEPVLFTKDDLILVTDLTSDLFPQIETELYSLRRVGARVYFVVHDILAVTHPQWINQASQPVLLRWLKSIVWYANGILCVSRHVAAEVRRWIGENAHQVVINPRLTIDYFHPGADLDSGAPSKGLPEQSEERLQQMQCQTSFIMVGTLEPRKGHMQVVQAFEHLWLQGKEYNLFIVGKLGWDVEALCEHLRQHPQRGKHLFWLQNISDEFLHLLYQHASALIFASHGEGFGLPVIEAAQRGLPLILRKLPVFEEIAGEHAWWFDSSQPEPLAQALEQWVLLYQQGLHPTSAGICWQSWQQSTEQLLSKLPLLAAHQHDS